MWESPSETGEGLRENKAMQVWVNPGERAWMAWKDSGDCHAPSRGTWKQREARARATPKLSEILDPSLSWLSQQCDRGLVTTGAGRSPTDQKGHW